MKIVHTIIILKSIFFKTLLKLKRERKKWQKEESIIKIKYINILTEYM